MLIRRHSAPLRFSICLAVVTLALATSCKARKSETTSSAPPSAVPPAASVFELPPADQGIIDLLGGLKKGDALGAGKVIAIGAVNQQGGIPINVIEERPGLPSLSLQIVVHTKADDPPAPFATAKYAVFYQSLGPLQAPMPDDFRAMIKELTDKLQRTEDKVPMPKGLLPAKKPGNPA
jgi:hypothetical protein